jgi:hypothetical protein
VAGGLREAAAAVGAVVGLAGILDATIADFSETLGVCFVELLKEEVGRTPLPRLFALFAGTFVREDDRGMPPHSDATRPTSYGHNHSNSDVLNAVWVVFIHHIYIYIISFRRGCRSYDQALCMAVG